LRLGYMVAHPDVVGAVRRLQPSWSVSAVAQAAGIAALDDDTYLKRMRTTVQQGKQILLDGLRALGLTVYHGPANFLLVHTGRATELRLRLLKRGFAVRDCTSFGLPEYIRLGVRTPDQCTALLAALTRELAVSLGDQVE